MPEQFDLSKVPHNQLVAFYGLCFSAAAVDGYTSEDELKKIYELMDTSMLNQKNKQKVSNFIFEPPNMDVCLTEISKGEEEFRYAVAFGLLEVVLADNIITKEEEEFIRRTFTRLRVKSDQRKAMEEFIHVAKKIAKDGVDNNAAEKALKGAVAGMGAVGVPLAAVYFSGSVIGLSAAGITSGLAAVGLGFGMIPGIGVAVLIGIPVFLGLKYLLGDSKAEREQENALANERKAQLVIKNLQDTISILTKKLNELEEKAKKGEAHQEELRILKERLIKLNQIMKQRQQVVAAA